MKSNKGNSKKNDESQPIDWDPVTSIEEMAMEAVKKRGVRKESAIIIARHLQHHLVSQLESYGEVDYFGIGLLKKAGEDDDVDYIFEPFQEEKEPNKPDIASEKAIMGSKVHLGNAISTTITFSFPAEKAVKLMAKKRGVPAGRLEEDFIKQLEEAYYKMIETGEGVLPDFGVLHYVDRKTGEFSFQPYDEFNDRIKEFKTSSLELYTGSDKK